MAVEWSLLAERLLIFGSGCIVGYILAKANKGLNRLDRINDNKNEGGAVKYRVIQNVALGLAVLATVWAAIQSNATSDRVSDTNDRLIAIQQTDQRIQDCTTDTLFSLVRAVNERTTYSQEQTAANVELQTAQLDLVQTLAASPGSAQSQDKFDAYIKALQKFVTLANQTVGQQNRYPYPTLEDYAQCLEAARRG